MPAPYVDLHLHLDGSLSVATARALSRLGQGEVDELSDEEIFGLLSVGDAGTCGDLNLYLAKFNLPLALLQTAEQLSACTYLLQEELLAQGFGYAELRFAPQHHHERGMSQREAVEAVLDGLARSAFEARVILCCMRGRGNEAENLETVELAREYLGRGVVAVDLAGAEALYPTAEFGPLFAHARELGVPFTIHAGEAGGPESVRHALDFGATRIGHGVRAAEDPQLLEELAARGVTLEVCPTSEVQTGVFGSIGAMPLRKLLDAGVRVAVCSDNMMVSATSVPRELALVQAAHQLSDAEVAALQLNAINAAFADKPTKASLRAAMDA